MLLTDTNITPTPIHHRPPPAPHPHPPPTPPPSPHTPPHPHPLPTPTPTTTIFGRWMAFFGNLFKEGVIVTLLEGDNHWFYIICAMA